MASEELQQVVTAELAVLQMEAAAVTEAIAFLLLTLAVLAVTEEMQVMQMAVLVVQAMPVMEV